MHRESHVEKGKKHSMPGGRKIPLALGFFLAEMFFKSLVKDGDAKNGIVSRARDAYRKHGSSTVFRE